MDEQKNRQADECFDRQTERNTNIKKYRQIIRKTGRYVDSLIYRLIDRQNIDIQTDSQKHRQICRQTDMQTDRHMDRQKDRQIDRQTDRQIDRQTDRQIDNYTDRQLYRQTIIQIDR